MMKILEIGNFKKEAYEDFILENGIVYKEKDGDKLLVIPRSMHAEIIRTAHEPGHFGVKKTESLINKNYFIPKISKRIEEYIGSCVPCILGNRKQGRQEGLLNPISKGNVPLDTYHLDHCGPFESTKKNYKYLLLMIDAFSKFVWIFLTKTLNTKEVVDKLTLHKVGDIVAIRRTQFGTQNKLFPRFLGPYKVVKVKFRDRNDVERVGQGEGPKITSSSADGIKPWKLAASDNESSGSDESQDGRAVGSVMTK